MVASVTDIAKWEREMRACRNTHDLGMDVVACLMNPLQREGDHSPALGGSGLHARRESKEEAREEQREGETELHSEEGRLRAILRTGRWVL